jgi:RNA polymerase sigma-70 factor (ECF subfamily)
MGEKMQPEETDENLLKQWLMGDAGAFERFYHRHSGKVFGYARKKGIPPDELPELVQEVFLKLHLYISQFEPEKKALPWFFTIVHNTCLDRLKKGGKAKQQWCAVSLDTLSENRIFGESIPPTEERGTERDLGTAMGSLNSDQKKVVHLRLNQEMSFEDMAMATGKSSASLRKSYSRAMQTLRNWFAQEKK